MMDIDIGITVILLKEELNKISPLSKLQHDNEEFEVTDGR